MANTNLIYTYIQDSGYKLQYVASVLHISSNTLRHKLLGETQFKLDEAERLCRLLERSASDRPEVPALWSQLANAWARAGRMDKAQAWLPALQRLAPRDPMTLWLASQARR